MTYEKAIFEIRQLMRRGLELPMHGCCKHRKEDIAYYLDPCQNSSFDSFKLEEYSNGFYLGNLKNEKRHGFGYYVWNHGSIYAGDWIENKKDGDGINIHSDGYVMFGEYSEGKLHGRCLSRGNNGIEIEADYIDDERVRVYDSSDNFIDEKGREYNRKNNFSGSKPLGCGGIIAIVIIIILLLKMCS